MASTSEIYRPGGFHEVRVEPASGGYVCVSIVGKTTQNGHYVYLSPKTALWMAGVLIAGIFKSSFR